MKADCRYRGDPGHHWADVCVGGAGGWEHRVLTTGQAMPLVYDELRKPATARMAHEQPCQMLQATALVHEAYARLTAEFP